MTINTPLFLTSGFRLFFMGAAGIALANMILWVMYLAGLIEIPSIFSPSLWHLHEMMFGFIAAALAGFLLTAVPNWTGRPALKGLNLFVLFCLWLFGRIVTFYSEYTGVYFAAIADLPFLYILGLYIFREVSAQGTKRNLPIVGIIFGFAIANTLMYVDYVWDIELANFAYRLAIIFVICLVMIIGGRIIPNFTRNWLKKAGKINRPILMNKFDMFCILATVASLLVWLVLPDQKITGVLLMLIGLLHGVRMSRWQLLAILKAPILVILQIAYAWLSVGIYLIGFFVFMQNGYTDIAIHAVTVGGFATMILGVMTRASLGHTGRDIVASRITIALYIGINVSVISRLLAPLLDMMTQELLYISAAAWVVTFGLFLIEYTPYFFGSKKTS